MEEVEISLPSGKGISVRKKWIEKDSSRLTGNLNSGSLLYISRDA